MTTSQAAQPFCRTSPAARKQRMKKMPVLGERVGDERELGGAEEAEDRIDQGLRKKGDSEDAEHQLQSPLGGCQLRRLHLALGAPPDRSTASPARSPLSAPSAASRSVVLVDPRALVSLEVEDLDHPVGDLESAVLAAALPPGDHDHVVAGVDHLLDDEVELPHRRAPLGPVVLDPRYPGRYSGLGRPRG